MAACESPGKLPSPHRVLGRLTLPERFLAEGFDGYLSKPVDILELVTTVRRHCGGPPPP